MNSTRKRKPVVDGEREGRTAKRRAKELSARITDSDDEPEFNPNQPLSVRELRNLYRSYTRYGLLDECWNEILKEAGLEGRNPDIIRATIDDWIIISEEAIEKQRSTQEEGKKEKKAILFDYKGAKKLNAETIIIRPQELKILKRAVDAFGQERTKFRINDVKLVHNWSCEWGTREDSMLCVGIVKHGYGGWTAIRDDPELGMHNKFFLEEHRVDKKEERGKAEATAKSPGAVHLVRRADYLLGVLKDRVERGLSRSGRKSPPDAYPRHLKRNGTASASPAPNSKKVKPKVRSVPTDSRRPRDKDREPKKRRHENDDGRDSVRKKRRPSLDAGASRLEVRRKRRPSPPRPSPPRPSPKGPSASRPLESRTDKSSVKQGDERNRSSAKQGDERNRELTHAERVAAVHLSLISVFKSANIVSQKALRDSEVSGSLATLSAAKREEDKARKSSMLMESVRNVGNYINRHSKKGSTEYQDLW
jgi:chromodomain-helicase-DNA-binding protein 1